MNYLLVSLVIGLVAGSNLPVLPAATTLYAWFFADILLIALCGYALQQARFRYRGVSRAVVTGVLLLVVLAGGMLRALDYGDTLWQHRLPEAWVNADIEVEGIVIHLPSRTQRGERFDFAVTRVLHSPPGAQDAVALQKLRLNAYDTGLAASAGMERFPFQPGQRWRLWVRLKPPRGTLDPGSFDYEGWLLQQGYSAVGYVRHATDNRPLFSGITLLSPLGIAVQFDRWGWASLQWIDAHIGDPDRRALFAAMALGYQEEFTRRDWDILKNTGTIHLVVVSGLNIVLAASAGFFLFGVVSRLLVLPLWWLPAPVWSALGALLTAVAYAGMTGFSLPTQRSLIMVLCGLASVLFRKRLNVSTAYLAALAIVMWLDPLAATTASLWLSFGAVAILLYCFAARVVASDLTRGWRVLLTRDFYVACIATQCAVSLGLFPLIAIWMGFFPLVTPLANLFAVPFATFVLMPLTMLSGMASALSPWAGRIVLSFCGQMLDLFWVFLDTAQHLDMRWYFTAGKVPATALMLLSLLAMAVWFAPRGVFRNRWQRPLAGMCLLLPLLLPWRDAIPSGEFRLTVVDVGQGLGLVVETKDSVTVYDVGDHYSDQFDMGRDVIAPIVRRDGFARIDTLVISHADSDHAGGLQGLLGELHTQRLLSGNPAIIRARLQAKAGERNSAVPVEACVRGQMWRNDDVTFEMLGPLPAQVTAKRNNLSCVLRISNPHFSVLLTGDIEQDAETLLLDDAAKLKSDVLVVPHHGSRSSSSVAFLNAVDPAFAIVSVGYHSQYGHPHPDIVERYRQLGIPLRRTDRSGAIRIDSQRGKQIPVGLRESATGYWHRW